MFSLSWLMSWENEASTLEEDGGGREMMTHGGEEVTLEVCCTYVLS